MAAGVQAQEGTTCHRSLPPPLPSQVTWRPVPLDLVSHCFNYLRADPVTAVCPNGARCLRCHREGHHARFCKRPRSSDLAGLPARQLRSSSTIVMLNPKRGNVALPTPTPTPPPRRSPPPQRWPVCGRTCDTVGVGI
jgi:hypothetical protein